MENKTSEEKAINLILGLGALWVIYKVIAFFWKFALVRAIFWIVVMLEILTLTGIVKL